MFGGNKKKKSGADGAKPSNSGLFDLSQLSGLAGIPQPGDMEEEDSALEAELAALIADDGSAVQSKSTARKKVPLSQIDHLAAEAMKSVDEEELTEEDLNDPSYLAELALLAEDDTDMDNLRPSPQPSPRPSPKSSPAPKRKSEDDLKTVIQERIQNYEIALKNAEAANESSKARRYGRGLKTLKDFDKKLQRGMKIDESEIPPVVATGQKQEQPSAPEPAPPPPDNETIQAPNTSYAVPVEVGHSTKDLGDSQMTLLKERQHEYKMAALEAKRAGQLQIAADHLRVAKQFDSVISAIEQGEDVDLSGMPPPPSSLQDASTIVPPPKQQMLQAPTIDVSSPAGHSEPTPSDSETEVPMPSTPLEALQLRHDSYKTLLDKATQEGNASKCRRLGRIVKSYQDAIKKEKAGRPVDYEELPALPGFPPIPPRGGAVKSPGQPSPGQSAQGQQSPGQQLPGQPSSPGQHQAPVASPRAAAASAKPALARPPSVKEAQNLKNLRVLVQRQKEYKTMALKAKKEGDRDEAMRLLKVAKGFDSMITASENGLPVNMDSIPPSPLRSQVSVDESEMEVEGVPASTSEEISADVLADSGQLYTRLIATLTKQVQICTSNEKQYSQLGNLSTSKRFGEMKKSCQQDLDLLVVSRSHSDPVPRFHFESRTIPSIRVCPDLTDTEVEVNIVRGTHYKLPSGEKDLDTFVKFEFPYPSDEPQSGKSGWGKGFETIEYNHASKLNIQRNRTFASCVKRRSVKFEVYYGRGFLRSDKLLAQASLKLAELETKCEIHESLPLYDGRKPTGGKLEVKVRLHHPLSGVKEDQTKEKWLVIDSTTKKPQGSTALSSPQKNMQSTESLEVLKWELEKLKKKIGELQTRRRSIPNELITLQKVTAERIQKLQVFMKEGSKEEIQAYANRLHQTLPGLVSQAKQFQQAGNVDKARVILIKKRLIENEISSLLGKDKR